MAITFGTWKQKFLEMSPHADSEDQLVEQPAIALFATLGWQTVSALDERFGPDGSLGRDAKGEVVLLPRLLSGQIDVEAA